MRRVLVDLLFFTGTKGGMESYVREVYSRLLARRPRPRVRRTRVDASWPRPTRRGSPGGWSTRASAARTASRGRAASSSRSAAPRAGTVADLVHCPANFGPLRSRVPVVLTVHDLLAFRHPEYVPGAYSRVLRWMIRVAARGARVASSRSAAPRATTSSRYLDVPADRIVVTPLAGSRPAGDAAPARSCAGRRREASLLAVGNRMPHKGFETLLEALARIDPDERPRLDDHRQPRRRPARAHRRPARPGRLGRPARLAEPRRARTSVRRVDRARLPDALRGLRPPARSRRWHADAP